MKAEKAFTKAMKGGGDHVLKSALEQSVSKQIRRCKYCGLDHMGKSCQVTSDAWRDKFNSLQLCPGAPCWRCVQSRKIPELCNHHSKDCK